IEDFELDSLGIRGGLHHDRRHRADQYSLRDPLRSVAREVAHDLSTTGRMSDERDVLQIERFDDGREIVRIPVHIVVGRSLLRATVTATLMRDHAEALLGEEVHLPVPRIGIARPTVRERYGWATAPVLVVDLCAVFAGNR